MKMKECLRATSDGFDGWTKVAAGTNKKLRRRHGVLF
jgi:hypothetical protein